MEPQRKKRIKKSSHTKIQIGSEERLNITNPINGLTYSQKYFQILDTRQKLPAYQQKAKFMKLFEENDVIILQGETGSGKTTQIPQFLLNTVYAETGYIACTQPRRIAAISVAKRVAEETDTTLGEYIGYKVRFNERITEKTQIIYQTDGMLMRELLTDPQLLKYSVILLDEAHERTINTDILLGILKTLIVTRKDTETPLKIVVMSATIEIERFDNFFEKKAPVMSIPGRMHEVEILYTTQPEESYLDACIKTALQIHLNEKPGDILVFLTGQDEIEHAVNQLSLKISQFEDQCAGPVIVLPLYGALSAYAQQEIFEKTPEGGRKIIFSTNIAETSVTIDGIVYVIDAGLSKQKVYNPRIQQESLLIQEISKSSAKQRAGRAGRTRAGKCYRLYTSEAHSNLEEHCKPELLRSELSSVVLKMLLLNVESIINFDYIDPPSPEVMMRALEILVRLKAVSPDCKITLTGKSLGNFPLEPRMAAVLLKSKELGVSEQALNAVSIINSGNWKYRPNHDIKRADQAHRTFAHLAGCDQLSASSVLAQFEELRPKAQKEFCRINYLNTRTLQNALKIKKQLKNILFNQKTFIDHEHKFQEYSVANKVKICFLTGYYMQVAFLYSSNMYKVLRDEHSALIHPGSFVRRKQSWVMYLQFALTSNAYLRNCSQIDPQWLLKLYPEIFKSENFKKDESRRRIAKMERHNAFYTKKSK